MEITEAELKAKIEEAVNAATEPLVEKNKQLLNEKKKLQRDQQIDPSDYQALEAQLDKVLADNKALTAANKKLTSDFETAQKAAQTESEFSKNMLVNNELMGALSKVNVPTHYQDAVKAMFAGKVELVADGDKRVAKIDGKPVHDFIGEWAKSDTGKYFVAAPVNSGGGVGGVGGVSKTQQDIDLSKLSGSAKLDAARSAKKGA